MSNAAKIMRVYINGAKIAEGAGSIDNVDRTGGTAIGAGFNGGDVATAAIDEVRIYNRSLLEAEVRELRVFESPIAGSILDGISGKVRVTCSNITTTQKVTFTSSDSNWSCTANGLEVNSGDVVKVTTQIVAD
jgi:hypothetical protein